MILLLIIIIVLGGSKVIHSSRETFQVIVRLSYPAQLRELGWELGVAGGGGGERGRVPPSVIPKAIL